MNQQNWIFDPGKLANSVYFRKNAHSSHHAEQYLIKEVRCSYQQQSEMAKAFSDEGADFCGVSEAFIKQRGWQDAVVDRGAMEVTYANGKTETVRQRSISLTIGVEELPAFEYDFHLCHIPNGCDLMMGVPWKRIARPIIDWGTDRIYTKESFLQEAYHEDKQSINHEATKPETNTKQETTERRFYYCDRLGFTKKITPKQAQKVIRKRDVEFVAIIPYETSMALYAEVLHERGCMKEASYCSQSAKNTDKVRRFEATDADSFRDTPGYPLICEFEDIFQKRLPHGPPVHGEHEMEVRPGVGAIYRQQWRLSPDQEKGLRDWTKEMLRAGLIRPSISPHGAPTFCIKKPVGWRIVHDYRAMNEQTVRQSTPMPRKDAIFDRMSGSWWLSCFDLLSGYYQIRMREKKIYRSQPFKPPMAYLNTSQCQWD